MKASEAKRLKELEAENARLKKLVANQALDIDMLKELALENGQRPAWWRVQNRRTRGPATTHSQSAVITARTRPGLNGRTNNTRTTPTMRPATSHPEVR